MSLNLNITNYINKILNSTFENPLDTIENNLQKFEHILSKIDEDLSQLADSFNPANPLDDLVNSITRLSTIIQTCSSIEGVLPGNGIEKYQQFKEKEFKLYASSLERLGIKGVDKKDYKEQLDEMVRLTKAHLISQNHDLNAKDANGSTMLHKACLAGDLEKVKLLVSYGADITMLDNEKNSCLHLAANTPSKSTELLEFLLSQDGIDIDAKDSCGFTPLLKAINSKCTNYALFLIDKKANVNLANDYDITPLHSACFHGSYEVVEKLIDENASLDIQSNDGHTALLFAIKRSNVDCAKLLINAKANVTIANHDGLTPLHAASILGTYMVVQELLANGANIDTQDDKGDSALICAVRRRLHDTAILLIDNGANARHSNKKGETALQIANLKAPNILRDVIEILTHKIANKDDLQYRDEDGNSKLLTAIINDDVEGALRLLVQGAKTNIANEKGETPFKIACQKGLNDLIVQLKANGADINARDKYGNTQFLEALRYKRVEFAEFLMDQGPDVNIGDNDGYTPLYFACQHGLNDMVQKLINKRANVDVQNRFFDNPLIIALKHGHLECAKILMNNEANINLANESGEIPLKIAFEQGFNDIVDQLLTKGVNVNVEDEYGNTLLLNAIQDGDKKFAQFLIDNKADVNLANKIGKTPLHIACSGKDRLGGTSPAMQENYTELAKLLIENDANLTVEDKGGRTPLHAAVDSNNIELAKLIIRKLKKDDKLDVKDGDGNTFLHRAICEGDVKLAELLINEGAEITIQDNDGQTPLHLAIHEDHHILAELLIEKNAGLDVKNIFGDTPLHGAIFDKKTKLAKLIIKKGVGLDIQNDDRSTPLDLVINANNMELAEMLIEKEAGLTVQNAGKNIPLYAAIAYGYDNLTALIIKKGIGLDIQNKKGNYPLHELLHKGNKECATLLIEKIIEKGANTLNLQNKDGFTPLHIACGAGLIKITKLLIANITHLDDQGEDGGTALIYALSNGKIKCAELLIESGVNVNLANKDRKTALHIASEQENDDLITKLIRHGADPYAVDSNGNSLILDIVKRSSKEVPVILVIIDSTLKSYQKKLLQSQSLPVDDQLLKGLEYNKVPVNEHGDTVLHIACRNQNVKLVQFFIEKGINVADKNIYAETPFTIALRQGIREEKELERLNYQKLNLELFLEEGSSSSSNYVEELKLLDVEIKKKRDQLKVLSTLIVEIISNVLETYITNSKDILGDALRYAVNFKSFENFIISILDSLISARKENTNPLEFALALNSPQISRSIAKELGKDKFEKFLSDLPRDIAKSLKESILYDIDHTHLAHKIEGIPDKPTEKEYQIDALLEMFDELSGYGSDNQILEPKFRKYLNNGDETQPLEDLRNRMKGFLDNCSSRGRRTGIEPGQEVVFWDGIERALTNTIKALKTFKGTDEEIYTKKVCVLCEYLPLMAYCATRLDVEFDKLYYENSGIIRDFPSEIYFRLSERRRLILESLAPRVSQSVHTIQGMLKKLDKYNIPIRQSIDLYPKKLTILDTEKSFLMKYQDGLIDDVKCYLRSNKDMLKTFFKMLEEDGRGDERPLPLEETKDFFKNLQEYLKKNNNEFSEELPRIIPDVLSNGVIVPKLKEDLYEISKLCEGHDFEKPETLKNVLNAYFDVNTWKMNDFEKIVENGDAAFEVLDSALQQAIVDLSLKGKLSLFQSKDKKAIIEAKEKILSQYIETNFPQMVKQVKDEDVIFLLQKFGVIKDALDVF